MKFQPQTDEEIKLSMCAPAGTYDFEVMDAKDGFSKKGNPMTTVTLKVFVGTKERTIKDYLLEAMAFKLKHFLATIGMAAAYDAGDLDVSTLIGKCGKVTLGIEEQVGYSPKNVVEDYLAPGKEAPAPKAAKPVVTSGSDEPPF
jgi:hypothetical protein